MANGATICAVGNLTRDPNHTVSKTGRSIVNFNMAVNTTKKDEVGNYVANFYNVVVFGPEGEYLLNTLQKGTCVTVVGDLIQDTYPDKNTGETRFALNIQASKVVPTARMKPRPQRTEGAAAQPAAQPAQPEAGATEKLPF